MINNFMFHFLNQLSYSPMDIDSLKIKWSKAIQNEIGNQFTKSIDNFFNITLDYLIKNEFVKQFENHNKICFIIEIKGIDAYAEYLTKVYTPNLTLEFAKKQKINNVFSNILALIALIVSIIAIIFS